MRRGAHVALDRVAGLGAAREALAGRDVGVLVVAVQDAARAGEVGRPVLGLAVGAHDAVVAADAEVVLGRDAAREVQRLLAREHHRALRSHDQNSAGMHQHRCFCVPIWLRADIYAGDDDIDFATVLCELDDAPQSCRHPVHVLRAGVHGDPRAGAEREPLDGHAELLGQVQGGDDPPALGLGDAAEGLRRIAQQDDAGHALGVPRREGTREPDHDPRLVHRRAAVHRDQGAVGVEVVLDELAARDRAARIATLGRQHLDQLRRVHRAAAAGLHDPPRALVQRLQRAGRRLVDLDDHATPGGGEEPQLAVAHDPVARVAHAAADDHGLDAEALGLAGVAVDQRTRLVRREVDRRPQVQPHAVPQQALPRGAARLEAPQRLQRLGEHVLELGQRDDAPVLVAHDRDVAHLGEREQPLVLRVGAADAAEQVDVRRARRSARARTPTCARGSAARPSRGARTAARGPAPSRRRCPGAG